jgi:hypothetical protein
MTDNPQPGETRITYLSNEGLLREFYALRDAVREREKAHEREVSKTITDRLRVIGWGGGFALLAGFVGLFLSYRRLENEYHEALQARLDQEFSTPRIHALIQERAQRTAVEVAMQSVTPQVEEARQLVADVRDRLESVLGPLLKAEAVFELQGQANAMDRYAFEELREIANDAPDRTVRTLAQGAYISARQTATFTHWTGDLESTGADGTTRMNGQISEAELLNLLQTGDPRQRGLAARWLAQKGVRCAVPVLVEFVDADRPDPLGVTNGERNLMSFRDEAEAILQLGAITDSNQAFDNEVIRKWWKDHRYDFSPCATSVPSEMDVLS